MQPSDQSATFDAILLDMDGTILTSIKAAERVWAQWARRHGLDVDAFLPTIHGMRAIETIRRLNLPGIDPEIEATAITAAEMDDIGGIEAIAGAAAFLDTLPRSRWAIVTSAPRALALRRIAAAGLPVPPLIIAAEDVINGKPAPDCFRLAAEKLGVAVEKCLIFEDSQAGITAAEKADAAIVVVTATHHSQIALNHPAIADYRDIKLRQMSDGSFSIDYLSFSANA